MWGREVKQTNGENLMEYLNRIEINGRIGSIRHAEVNGSKVTNFTVASEYLYKTRDGSAVIETTWFNITAWHNRDMHDFDRMVKGMPVHVTGRIRSSKYTTAEGVDKQFYEVMANKVEYMTEE